MTRRFNHPFLPLVLLALPLLGGTAHAEQETLSGTVAYDNSIGLPAGSFLEVRLLDISIPGAPARVVTHYTLPAEGDPIAFTLPFDDGMILSGHRYALDARIGSSSTLWFSSTQNLEVAPLSEHYPVNITVQAIALPPVGEESKTNTTNEDKGAGDDGADLNDDTDTDDNGGN